MKRAFETLAVFILETFYTSISVWEEPGQNSVKPRLNDQTFSSNIVLEERMLDRSAASLNIAFKWFPMFEQVQTFSSNILHYKEMFYRLAILSHKTCYSGKKQPITSGVSCMSCHNFSGNAHKALYGLIY